MPIRFTRVVARRSRGLALGVVVACLAVGIAAVAVASIPDAQGIIHACYNNDTGALRVIDSDAPRGCNNAETRLNFNQKGPAGPAGPQGALGPQGPQGPPAQDSTGPRNAIPAPPAEATKGLAAPTRGLTSAAKRRLQRKFAPSASKSDVRSAFSTWRDSLISVPDKDEIDPLNPSQVTLAALDVPAGEYVAVAKATVLVRADLVHCRLQAGVDYDTIYRSGGAVWQGLTLTVVHRFAQPGRIELRCYQTGASPTLPGFPKNSKLGHTKITAMQFDQLSNKPL